jgi:hypothetical protein
LAVLLGDGIGRTPTATLRRLGALVPSWSAVGSLLKRAGKALLSVALVIGCADRMRGT